MLIFCASVFAQKDIFQPEFGFSITPNTRYSFSTPDGSVQIKSRPAESAFLGFRYHRQLKEVLYFHTGIVYSSINHRHLLQYREGDYTYRQGFNNWGSGFCIKLPAGLEARAEINSRHSFSAAFSLLPVFLAGSQNAVNTFIMNASGEEIQVLNYVRDEMSFFQLFASLRINYNYHTSPERRLAFFFAFEPQITKATHYTRITLMPGSPQESTFLPFLNNSSVQFGMGYGISKSR
ncbi:MAG: hypothetical protein ACT6QS_15150 [Flavobacteriales bacterium]